LQITWGIPSGIPDSRFAPTCRFALTHLLLAPIKQQVENSGTGCALAFPKASGLFSETITNKEGSIMFERCLSTALAAGALILSGSVAAQELKIALIAGKTGPLEAYAKDTEKRLHARPGIPDQRHHDA